jgi:hypothetical protein
LTNNYLSDTLFVVRKETERSADQDNFRLVIKENDFRMHQVAGDFTGFHVSKIAGNNQQCEFSFDLITRESIKTDLGIFEILPVTKVTKEEITTGPDEVVISIKKPELEKDYTSYWRTFQALESVFHQKKAS